MPYGCRTRMTNYPGVVDDVRRGQQEGPDRGGAGGTPAARGSPAVTRSRNPGDHVARNDVAERRQRERCAADLVDLHDVRAAVEHLELVVAAWSAADPMERDLIREGVHGSRLVHLHEDFREPGGERPRG